MFSKADIQYFYNALYGINIGVSLTKLNVDYKNKAAIPKLSWYSYFLGGVFLK